MLKLLLLALNLVGWLTLAYGVNHIRKWLYSPIRPKVSDSRALKVAIEHEERDRRMSQAAILCGIILIVIAIVLFRTLAV
jgi:hypothetical protein